MESNSNSLQPQATALLGLIVEMPCGASPHHRRLRPSRKQCAIMAALHAAGTITLAEAVELIGRNIYCNAEKHVGSVLSNMVKRGLIRRVRPGVFSLPNNQGEQSQPGMRSATR